MKKNISILLVVMLVATLFAGCGNSSQSNASQNETQVQQQTDAQDDTQTAAADESQPEEAQEQSDVKGVVREVLNIGISQDASNWCPFAHAGTATTYIGNICERLGVYEKETFYPILMKSYEISEDGKTFTGELFDYIKDSNGNPIKASDVVFAYEKGSGEGGTTVNFNRYVESFKETGDYTFEIQLNQSMPVGVLAKICKLNIFSQKSYEDSPDGMVTMPIGSGPYLLKEHTSGYMYSMEKRDDYWQTDEEYLNIYNASNVQTMNFYVIAEASQRTIAMEKGSIDTSPAIASVDIDKFVSSGDYWTSVIPADVIYAMQPNCHEDTACGDINLRKAIFYAIDNDSLIASVLGVNGFALHTIAPENASCYNPEWENEENYLTVFDPDLAKEYLSKSNYKGETLVLLCQADDTFKNLAQVIIGFLENVGIKCEMQALDSAVFREKLTDNTAWDLQINNCATNGTAIELINGEHSTARSGTDRSRSFIKDDEYQAMIANCMLMDGFTQENVDELFDYIIDNAYFYSLSGLSNLSVNPNWVVGEVPSLASGILYPALTYTEE